MGDVNNAGPNHTMAGRPQAEADEHPQLSVGQIVAMTIPHSTRTKIKVTHQTDRRVITPPPRANMAAAHKSHVINGPGAMSDLIQASNQPPRSSARTIVHSTIVRLGARRRTG